MFNFEYHYRQKQNENGNFCTLPTYFFLLNLFVITLKLILVTQVELLRKAGKRVETSQILILLPQATALPASSKPIIPKLFFIEET